MIDIFDEFFYEILELVFYDLDIVYEDDYFLILNKFFGFVSIFSFIYLNIIVNFIKYYYVFNNYVN